MNLGTLQRGKLNEWNEEEGKKIFLPKVFLDGESTAGAKEGSDSFKLKRLQSHTRGLQINYSPLNSFPSSQ